MITIVEATTNDFGIIKNLAYEIWPATYGAILSAKQLYFMLDAFYSEEALQQNVDTRGHHFLLVKDGSKKVGFAAYELNYHNKTIVRLHKIYLLPETQGKGIGKLLIDCIARIGTEHEMEVISLNVNRFNSALTFYQKMGFEIKGEENIQLEHGYLMEDYIMEKQLQ